MPSRSSSLITAILLIALLAGYPPIFIAIPLVPFAALSVLGTMDLIQTRHAVLRNYPLTAHIRFILEEIRPEIRQYFLESEKDGTPFSRDKRALVYQRAKRALDKRPFGTQNDVYLAATSGCITRSRRSIRSTEPFRVDVGGPDCAKPYSASIFNISAMSFGALSPNAIRSLNIGARKGNFAHDTGEGGYSSYHRENGGDLIWEIGSGYFSCRNADGTFCAGKIRRKARKRPGQDGRAQSSARAPSPAMAASCPAPRSAAEIAATRGVPIGVDCISPSRPFRILDADRDDAIHRHDAAAVRRQAGRVQALHRPSVGIPRRSARRCWRPEIYPDFIVIDGKEGGTGAAPLEFTDHLGMPLREGLNFVHNALIGINARDRIRLGACGKIISAFDIARVMALGADWCNSARGFMFALGCIQSQSCHTGRCPTGVSTQDPVRQRALVVPDKAERVYNFHRATMESLAELVAAAGLDHPTEFVPAHFSRRVSPHEVQTFAQLYPPLEPGELLAGTERQAIRHRMGHGERFGIPRGGVEPLLAGLTAGRVAILAGRIGKS